MELAVKVRVMTETQKARGHGKTCKKETLKL